MVPITNSNGNEISQNPSRIIATQPEREQNDLRFVRKGDTAALFCHDTLANCLAGFSD